MKNDKGITLTSLVVYIAVIFVVMAIVMRITTYFVKNMEDAADVKFESEFNKLKLYLLDESKTTDNKILEIKDEKEIIFSKGNKYTYNETNKAIYLNDKIRICENIENVIFSKEITENGKEKIVVTITINKTTKKAEYVMPRIEIQNEINEGDYTI